MLKVITLIVGTASIANAANQGFGNKKQYYLDYPIQLDARVNIYHPLAPKVQGFADTFHAHYNSISGVPLAGLQFIEGLFDGLFNTDFSAIEQCQSGAADLFTQFDNAIHDFSSMSISGVTTGCKHLYDAIKQIPSEFSTCKAISGNLASVTAWIKKFANPAVMAAKISKNMIFHAIGVYKDAKSGISSWNSKDFKTSGQNFGHILQVLTN
ncbi:UNKNOWN [Stylonychia lemnae]|uniref:Uncharacterized protein n=1 Tax=Stylonychia lemnae TaxID=5949 RepID=A0A078B962_STYLE|nr:UNKNOWN [Stylonychia lemnae]|eukprot:CDW90776.1 UNKNOWN [Stylonychia lemnae]